MARIQTILYRTELYGKSEREVRSGTLADWRDEFDGENGKKKKSNSGNLSIDIPKFEIPKYDIEIPKFKF
jgi:hypothetical protein